MGTEAAGLEQVARLIQLAVAPVFLLTAVATTLMVLTGRLARIVDRGRSLEKQSAADRARREGELERLERRAHLIYRALSLGVSAALCVCLLMTTAFLGEIWGLPSAKAVVVLFIGALFSYTGALVCLLREVFLAIAGFELRIHPPSNQEVRT